MLKRVLGGKSRHNNKAFNWRFVLDVRKLRNFHVLSEHCNDECPRDVSICASLMPTCRRQYSFGTIVSRGMDYKGVLYSYLAWTFALLRSTVQGNAKASERGTSNNESSTSSFFAVDKLSYLQTTESGTIGQFTVLKPWVRK